MEWVFWVVYGVSKALRNSDGIFQDRVSSKIEMMAMLYLITHRPPIPNRFHTKIKWYTQRLSNALLRYA